MLEERSLVATNALSSDGGVSKEVKRLPSETPLGFRSSSSSLDSKPMQYQERAFELSKHISVPRGRLCVLRVQEDRLITIPRGIIQNYEEADLGISSYDWPLAVVVASGIDVYQVGSFVRTLHQGDLEFLGGQKDPDSPTLSNLLRSGENLCFFLPSLHLFRLCYNKGRSAECQMDIGDSVIGV